MQDDETTTARFAKFLKEKRIAMGLTQIEMIAIIGLEDRGFLSKIENGRPITIITMDKILAKLDCYIEFNEN